jgi:hypothetical protein
MYHYSYKTATMRCLLPDRTVLSIKIAEMQQGV